ncbi:TetR/AcrR family transcriptional regulator [Nocardioides maradonensis]
MASTPAPLRPGPAGPDRAAELRDRILDAAVACILKEGLNARLHALIAQRAGVSRPTVYKYVGDQDAVLAGLVDREIDRFFAVVLPLLRVGEDVVPDLIDGITLIVDYAHRHELLQIALRDHPEIVLPALTTRSGPVLERCQALFARPLAQALALADEEDARIVTEWLFRVIVSLITTPGSVGQASEDVRAHVTRLLTVIGVRERNRA